RVVDVLWAAAAAAASGALIGPDAQGDSDHLMALLLEQSRGGRRVHAAAHGYNKPHHLLLIERRQKSPRLAVGRTAYPHAPGSGEKPDRSLVSERVTPV